MKKQNKLSSVHGGQIDIITPKEFDPTWGKFKPKGNEKPNDLGLIKENVGNDMNIENCNFNGSIGNREDNN